MYFFHDREMSRRGDVPPEYCVEPFRLDRYLASGEEADVISTCLGSNCSFVTRVIHDVSDIVSEFQRARIASNVGIGPRVLLAQECEGKGIVIMERLDIDMHGLEDMTELHTPGNIAIIRGELERLQQVSTQEEFLHGDLHPGNIMFRLSHDRQRVERAFLIDFSRSGLGSPEAVDNEWDELKTSFIPSDDPILAHHLGFVRPRPPALLRRRS